MLNIGTKKAAGKTFCCNTIGNVVNAEGLYSISRSL